MSSKNSQTLFLTWQPELDRSTDRRVLPVGRLDFDGVEYRFEYLHGVLAARDHGFAGLMEFPQIGKIYTSERLFPVFANRLMSPKRKDYADYVAGLGLTTPQDSPAFDLEVLGRSTGQKATDGFRVFPYPEKTSSGFRVRFFLERTPHDSNLEEMTGPHPLDSVFIEKVDVPPNSALRMKARNGAVLGHIPSFFQNELQDLLNAEGNPGIKILQVNTPPARWAPNIVLIEICGPWPSSWQPYTTGDFAALPAGNSVHRRMLQPSVK